MAATLEAAVQEVSRIEGEPTVAGVLSGLARGALYGGRGNSGVILSQTFKGLAKGVGEASGLDAAGLARGLEEAARAAYAAVAAPSEGTMLTVLRVAAEAASTAATQLQSGGKGAPSRTVLASAVRAAEAAEAATPTQLAELAEAGVTDAGGEGICVILRGLLAALSGDAPPAVATSSPTFVVRDSQHETYGHCTEFMLEGNHGVDRVVLAALLDEHGARSVVLVGGEGEAFRVHAHLTKPDALIEAVAPLGRVLRLKVDDMDQQHVRFASSGSGSTVRLALLALSPGPGFDRVFASLGARTAPLALSEKPSAGEIASAAERLGVPDVIVLPNHKNVLLAAQQAVGIARCTLHVVPTQFVPAGVAAAMAFDPDRSPDQNSTAMHAAAATVRTIEVTIAAGDTKADGLSVQKGDAIALIDGRLSVVASTPIDAIVQGAKAVDGADAALITVYSGAEVDPAALNDVRKALAQALPGAEIEVLDGGQALYPFIASVEA